MSSEYVQYTPRRPRYACIAPTVRVEVEQTVDGLKSLVQAELLDLSRSGYQVKVPAPLNTQSPLNLRICIEASQIGLTLSGTVRWQRPTEDGTWLAGCESDRPLEWETLGELFLSGVLSTGILPGF
jgi:hypothetical protein